MVNHLSNLIKTVVFNEERIKWYHNISLRSAVLWEKGSYWYIPRKLTNLLNWTSLRVAMVRRYFKCKKYKLSVFDCHYLAYTNNIYILR